MFSVLIFVKACLAFSQSLEGALHGSVVDSFGVVPGVLVRLDSLGLSTVTNAAGKFNFFKIPAGNYQLSFHAIGYEKAQLHVDVYPMVTTYLTPLMLASANTLGEVEVSAKAKNDEARAINQTKNSLKIVTIKSADEIHKLPTKNAADIAARLPSVALFRNKGENSMVSLRGTPNDWSAVLINGDRLPVACEENTTRSFEFEAFPSDFVDEVIEARSVTPDLESDNIGGSINFLTHPAVESRTFELNAAAGYHFLAKKPTGNFKFLYGDISRNKAWSFVTTGSYYGRNYAADATKVIYGSNFNHGINRLELRRYDGLRVTMGGNASVEYRPNPKFRLGTHAFIGSMTDEKHMKKESFNWYEDNGQRLRLQNTSGNLIRQIYGGDVYADYNPTHKLRITARLATYSNEFKYGDTPFSNKNDPRNGFFVTEFMSPSLTFTDYSTVDFTGKAVDPNAQNFIFAKLIGADEPYGKGDSPLNIQPHFKETLTPNQFQFTQSYTEINHTQETDPIVAQADAEYTLSNRLKLQFGVKLRNKQGFRHISKHEWFQDYSSGNSQPILLSDYETQAFSTDKDGFLKEQGANYQGLLYPFLNKAELTGFLSGNATKLREVEMNKLNYEYYQWVGSNYDYAETQTAGYAMVTYASKKVALLAGIRIENTSLIESSDTLTSNLGYDVPSSTYYYIPERRTIHKNYIAYLPSLNVNYFISQSSNLRLAASRTMHRPNFEETKPGHAVVRYNDLEYTFGNPQLRPVFSSNVDVAFEHYWGTKGLFSIGGYYKNIKDHIFTVTTANTDPISGITVKRYANADNSWVAGIELLLNRRFDFLAGWWSGFGINTNLTYSFSRMKVPGRPKAQQMSEQTPLLYNVTLVYERKKIETRIALLYNGAYLAELNLASIGGNELIHKDSDFDTFVNAYYSLDYQFTWHVRKHLSVYLELNNLLNAPERKYIGETWRTSSTEYYRMKGQLGLQFEL